MQKVTGDEWSSWVNSPVTQAICQYLQEQANDILNESINLSLPKDKASLEKYGMQSLAARYAVDGIGQFLDFETLKEILVEEDSHDN